MRSVAVVLAFLSGCAPFERPSAPPVRVVQRVDLTRYAGTWYEIAKYPNRFQKGCVATSATYTLLPSGRAIEVVNRCRRDSLDGPFRSVTGKARVVDEETNARLKVTFFWPFSGDYWIIDLGDEYEYAVVATPNRKYLWILSRTPAMDDNVYERIRKKVSEQHFDPSRLEMTPQSGP
jgi:apolipoprotein D and lipocalin family protein